MPAKQPFIRQRFQTITDSIKHHIYQSFYIVVFNAQSVILNPKPTGYAASHGIRVEKHTFDFG